MVRSGNPERRKRDTLIGEKGLSMEKKGFHRRARKRLCLRVEKAKESLRKAARTLWPNEALDFLVSEKETISIGGGGTLQGTGKEGRSEMGA